MKQSLKLLIRRGARKYSSPVQSSAQPKENVSEKKSINADIKPLENFVNRNPRSLERLYLAHKDLGWGGGQGGEGSRNWPNRDYYNRIHLQKTNQNTHALLEHYRGKIIFSVSTKEWNIKKRLYKSNDVATAKNIGALLAERCIRAGISCAKFNSPPDAQDNNERITEFCNELSKNDFILDEPDQVRFRKRFMDYKAPKKATPPRLDDPY